MEFKRITYGNSKINFQLFYKERKTLGIKVYPDGAIIVTAPLDSTIEKITEKDASLKGFWAETTKITELKDCKHSLAPVLKSKRLTTKGIIF